MLLIFVYSNEELDDILRISFVKADDNTKSNDNVKTKVIDELEDNEDDKSDNSENLDDLDNSDEHNK